MSKGQKKGENIVKIQVEAKNPAKQRKKASTKTGIPKSLINNFVGLQKVQTNLAEKIDALTKQLSELLRLFETTAKTFAENPAVLTSERDKEFLSKINQLLEQDKVIARGVVYIEERIDEIERSTAGRPLPHSTQKI